MNVTDPNPEELAAQAPIGCEDVLDMLYLFVSNEVTEDERAEIQAHLETCQTCAAALLEHGVLQKELPQAFSKRQLYYYSVNN